MLCLSRWQQRGPLQMQRQASRRAWSQLLQRMCRRRCYKCGTTFYIPGPCWRQLRRLQTLPLQTVRSRRQTL